VCLPALQAVSAAELNKETLFHMTGTSSGPLIELTVDVSLSVSTVGYLDLSSVYSSECTAGCRWRS
jgi:hypothetical protein